MLTADCAWYRHGFPSEGFAHPTYDPPPPGAPLSYLPGQHQAGRASGAHGDVPGAVPGGPQHRGEDVRVGGDGGVSGGDVRARLEVIGEGASKGMYGSEREKPVLH